MLRLFPTRIVQGCSRPGRADRAIYGGRAILYGKQAAEDKKSPKKSTRRWLPNVQRKRYFSDILERDLPLKITPYAMRCIDKAGGFDRYLLFTEDHKLDSKLAIKLKCEIQEKILMRQIEDPSWQAPKKFKRIVKPPMEPQDLETVADKQP